jgi:hypothetical protein
VANWDGSVCILLRDEEYSSVGLKFDRQFSPLSLAVDGNNELWIGHRRGGNVDIYEIDYTKLGPEKPSASSDLESVDNIVRRKGHDEHNTCSDKINRTDQTSVERREQDENTHQENRTDQNSEESVEQENRTDQNSVERREQYEKTHQNTETTVRKPSNFTISSQENTGLSEDEKCSQKIT